MGRSLGFAAYRAFSRRMSKPSPTKTQPRPDGDLLWLHATSSARLAPLLELGKRLQGLRDDLLVLITAGFDLADPPAPNDDNVRYERLSSDHPAEVARFLDHWRPGICVWAGADLMPNLVAQTNERTIPMILIDVGRDDFTSRNHKWFPDLTRESLARFEIIMTVAPDVSTMLHRIGVPKARISVAEPLRNGPSPVSIDEDCLSVTSHQLAGRPLWLAAHVQANEFEPVLSAHRFALRLIHRLLLVVSVDDPGTIGHLTDTLANSGLRYSQWSVGDDIDDNTQVLLSDSEDNLGLWYRMAPLTFMASSLGVGSKGHSPLDAVALGSAILYGPHVADHRDIYARLAAVGAGRSVGDADGLGAAVIRLVAPDHAAAMALEGWQIVTEGAALTDQLVDLVQDRLDRRPPTNARA